MPPEKYHFATSQCYAERSRLVKVSCHDTAEVLTSVTEWNEKSKIELLKNTCLSRTRRVWQNAAELVVDYFGHSCIECIFTEKVL